jgi:hypothetical protein
MVRVSPWVLLSGLLLSVAPTSALALPPLPSGWPTTLQLGVADGPGGAAVLETAGFGFRYQYLAGGVNTGTGWATWNTDGAFVTDYVQDSLEHGLVPVFSYYMMVQSAPGNAESESRGVYTNLQDRATMTAYYQDLRLFFQRAGAFPGRLVVLHVEPDLWGYMQQQWASGDSAASVPAAVSSTGLPELAGLPETLSGFARAIVTLRDAYAPNVQLAYHVSIWGTNADIAYSDPPDATVAVLAHRAAAFFTSLQAGFDLVFGEFSDRDAGFKQYVSGDGGASWWDAGDFARHVRFLGVFAGAAGKRVVLWQIPLGNTKMRAMNNTWDHYQDNRAEWLLDDPSRAHLLAYVQAGVVGFLFGRGADGATCACDAAGDGVTDPSPINGNTGVSLSADDDGGFFRQKAAAYSAAGAIALDASAPAPPPDPPALVLALSSNGPVFHAGETLVVSVGLTNPGLAASVDFYFGALLPDGHAVVSFAGLELRAAVATLDTLPSLPPLVGGASLAAPFTVSEARLVSHTWSGAEPSGRYVFFLAVTAPGGLRLASILALSTVAVTLATGPP